MNQRSWEDPDDEAIEGGESLADPEGPQARDLVGSGDDDDYDTLPCPHCGREISELAEQCPHCGDWIVSGGEGGRRKAMAIVIAAILLILILLWAL